MLTAMTDVKGSAGYVAIERVSGTLRGRAGTFALQHTGTMTRGAPSLTITVVPDSGTYELAGLSGRMTIILTDGKHSYELEYALNAAPIEREEADMAGQGSTGNVIAALASFFIPGLGQLLQGRLGMALVQFCLPRRYGSS